MEGRLLTYSDGVAPATPSSSSEPHPSILKVRGVSKSFPGTTALDAVDLDLRAGRVTALVGHNGSGKSTLVKVLSGLYEPDGDTGAITGPADSADWRNSLHFIHQDLGLVSDLNTLENLDLSRSIGWNGLRPVQLTSERRKARGLMADFDIDFDLEAPVRDLSPAQRTVVAIARALSGWTSPRQVLILDEPTAALQDREAKALLGVIRRVARRGAAVLFISHRLAEVEQLADDVVVLRDGQVIATAQRGGFTARSLVELIAGSELGGEVAKERGDDGAPDRLVTRGLAGPRLHNIDLTVGAGEIVGISGVIGSGIEDLLGTIFGSLPRQSGSVSVDDRQLDADSPRQSIAGGLGFVPRDRHRHGAVMAFNARENMTLPRLAPLRRLWGSVHLGRERAETQALFRQASVRPDLPERTFAQFSGGNQQKIVLSKWMRNKPQVLLLEEPTQGVDVGAQAGIYELVRAVAAGGAAVLVASSDTKELVTLCHRVLVLNNGEIATELAGERLTEASLVRQTISPEHQSRA